MALPEEGRVGEEVKIDRLQCVVGKSRETAAAHLQRADVWVGKAHFQPGELMAEKTDIEDGVVGDEDTAGDEIIKTREGLLRYDGTQFDGNRADLDDPVAVPWRKPLGFKIDDHVPAEGVRRIFPGEGAHLRTMAIF